MYLVFRRCSTMESERSRRKLSPAEIDRKLAAELCGCNEEMAMSIFHAVAQSRFSRIQNIVVRRLNDIFPEEFIRRALANVLQQAIEKRGLVVVTTQADAPETFVKWCVSNIAEYADWLDEQPKTSSSRNAANAMRPAHRPLEMKEDEGWPHDRAEDELRVTRSYRDGYGQRIVGLTSMPKNLEA